MRRGICNIGTISPVTSQGEDFDSLDLSMSALLAHGLLNSAAVISTAAAMLQEQWERLEPEVRRFEPKDAVVGGETGLEIILELLEQVRMWLAPGGWLVIEIADSQAERVSRLLGILGYRDVAVTKDLAGRDRVVEARWVGLP